MRSAPPHPLDPLRQPEFRIVTEALAAAHGIGEGWRYTSIEGIEPSKDALAAYNATGSVPPRRARATCLERAKNRTFRALVDLDSGQVESFEHVPDVQPNVTNDEWAEADAALRTHPDVIDALASRGVTDLSLVFIDTWTYGGHLVPEKYAGRRLGWADIWVKSAPQHNPYAGPLNGLHFVVDLNSMELLEIEDSFQVERPTVMGEYVPRFVSDEFKGHRPSRKPLEISQPEGPGFDVDGYELRWQNWRMRVGFNYREGMTLHTISYNDAGRERPIAHRLSLAEMVVPYRDPSVDHYRRTAFDVGEWGLGFMTQSLKLGCDCLGEIRYLDVDLHNSKGEPYTIPQAICIHEEDSAVGWKHVDPAAGVEVRRQRRFVVSFQVTVANYEYITYWRFYEDGNIECEVRATGIMVVTNVAEGAEHPHGTLVDNRTYAPFHQHFLVARMDLDIDGTENTVVRSDTVADPIGPDNPHGLGIRLENTPLVTEGFDDYSWDAQRTWKIVNPNSTNSLGTPVAYKLAPTGTFPSFFQPESPVLRRSQVIGHTVWVTPNADDERWPSGEFVVQSTVDHGLPEWIQQQRTTENTDVVVWYVFGIHHITRPEEWPVMPVDAVSFWLKPSGFFDRNPSLDVEPQPGHGADSSAGHCGDGCTCSH